MQWTQSTKVAKQLRRLKVGSIPTKMLSLEKKGNKKCLQVIQLQARELKYRKCLFYKYMSLWFSIYMYELVILNLYCDQCSTYIRIFKNKAYFLEIIVTDIVDRSRKQNLLNIYWMSYH